VGDFNFAHIDWASVSGIKSQCNSCDKFLDTLQNFFLTQHVQSATRARGMDTPHLLDLVITDTQLDIVQDITFHSPLGKSDHAVLKIDCMLQPFMVNSCAGKINYGNGDYDSLRKSLYNVDWIQSLGSCDGGVDQMWDYFKSTLLSRIEQYIPIVSISVNGKKPHGNVLLTKRLEN